jgi:uncharacterized protein YhaN
MKEARIAIYCLLAIVVSGTTMFFETEQMRIVNDLQKQVLTLAEATKTNADSIEKLAEAQQKTNGSISDLSDAQQSTSESIMILAAKP